MREDVLEAMERKECEAVFYRVKDVLDGVDLGVGMNACVYVIMHLIEKYCDERADISQEISDQFSRLAGHYGKKSG